MPLLARLGQRYCRAAAPGTARPADSMQVHLWRRGHVVVDDVREMLDVESARRDIGRNQQVAFCGAKKSHDAVALLLHHAAVERFGAVSVSTARFDERFHFEPRPAEHERRHRIFHVENPLERGRLLSPADDVGHLPHAGHLAWRGFFAGDGDARRLLQVAFRNRQDARRHRRREQRGLTRFRRGLKNGIEILGEAHVEHLVGFVEHQHAQAIQLRACRAVCGPARGPAWR